MRTADNVIPLAVFGSFSIIGAGGLADNGVFWTAIALAVIAAFFGLAIIKIGFIDHD